MPEAKRRKPRATPRAVSSMPSVAKPVARSSVRAQKCAISNFVSSSSGGSSLDCAKGINFVLKIGRVETVLIDEVGPQVAIGRSKADAPEGDPVEEVWKTYYRSIFNPARVKVGAMLREMPKKYWRNMPETALVPESPAAHYNLGCALAADGKDVAEHLALGVAQPLPVVGPDVRGEPVGQRQAMRGDAEDVRVRVRARDGGSRTLEIRI